ncbi:hypothetical protein E3O06_16215 [Cryobacterium glaciale]|uniref:Uncharacterized protein n=1 Tax=Cryobacterium glaciale TaxID=1259145 RepID=A0A4R8UPD4_9MICO|nr:hypothetical protein [Cryobacterium glaciale]TFB69018.1 hypothetical protein E3O06_16215 [Cryobacterium glaciale]
MQPADPAQPAAEPADDDLDEATRIVRRGGPRHGAAPVPSISSEPADLDDDTVIVQRNADEHTRIVARQPRGSGPTVAAGEADTDYADTDPADEATVRSSRGSTAADTLLSSRRAAAPVHTPVADALQRRYEPPQVQSGASVRYAARPTPAIIAPKAPLPVADAQPDPSRLRLADAAAEIRERAAAVKRRRRRFTLVAIMSTTVLAVLAAAGYTVLTVFTW